MIQEKIKIIIEERSGIERIREPLTVGIPFPRGLLGDDKSLGLCDTDGTSIPLQTKISAKWPDQSIKWVLIDFFADCPPSATIQYTLKIQNSSTQYNNEIKFIEKNDHFFSIDTGRAVFTLDKKRFLPFASVTIDGEEWIDTQKSCVIFKDESQNEFIPVINKIEIETRGILRSTVRTEGRFESESGKSIANFIARLSFYAGKSIVKINFTIRNPKSAEHPGGLWDLGDKGSIYFDDLSLQIGLCTNQEVSIFWKTEMNGNMKMMNGNALEIYQDSSGGENWSSPNHVNRYGKVMNRFRGFRVTSNNVSEEGYRARPTIAVTSDGKTISAAVKDFWQNFPKSIEASGNALTIRFFPKQYNDLFELQGGEQKTHTCFLNFNQEENNDLEWTFDPLIPGTSPEWYAKSLSLGYMAPANRDKNPDYQKLINHVIEGADSFIKLREKIDEYGWRNFGDVFAGHEAAAYEGSLFPLVSHYNNQYDVIYGCLLQYARSGSLKWYRLMADLAKHVIDIDIYHTGEDRPAFNGGAFWHTDHFMHAETSTHRSFAKKNAERNNTKSYGGGPSPENCYTTGLSIYYFLTGDILARDAVIKLADWIMNRDRIEMSFLGILRKAKKAFFSLFDEYSDAPGRSQANSINTLLDAFEITGEKKYLLKTEDIIKKSISPRDNINRLHQQQIELRWSYLMFLQSTGKYLDIKSSLDERDKMFRYASESLMHHAKWMLKNEKPYKQLFHIVEIQSSTWSAQDIRKSVVFDYASEYSNGFLSDKFREKAECYYNTSISDVLSFNDESKTFVRPLAILMNYGVMHTYFQNLVDNATESDEKN